MANSVIKARNILTESKTIQLTWNSASNPYAQGNVDLNKNGYIPISVSYTITGTGGTQIFASAFRLAGDGRLEYSVRNTGTPGSLTQNSIVITTKYIRA